jgi:DNA-binding transcriptional MerR regulator
MKTAPTYNLKVVIRKTGIKPDTLRAWERRYELPQPSRTEGGHRLYSDRDISTIHWLNDRINEGLRIKQAVNMWKEMESSGQDPLLIKPVGTQPGQVEHIGIGESSALKDMRDAWYKACLNFDEKLADKITNFAFALYPVDTVCFEVLLGGLAKIGDAWYQGEASVQQEHFASPLVVRRLDALIAATPPPTRSGTILVACSTGDDHTIAPMMLTLILRQRGWQVVYLGANVPLIKLEDTIQSIKPLIVVVTAQHLVSAAALLDMANALVHKEVKVAYGGLVFLRNPELIDLIPGFYLGDQMKTAANNLEEFLFISPQLQEIPALKSEYEDALDFYTEMLPAIESQLSDDIKENGLRIDYLSIANKFLSDNISAVLSLGNLELLATELNWVDALIANYKIQSVPLKKFLKFYAKATQTVMGQTGELIYMWLNASVDKHHG